MNNWAITGIFAGTFFFIGIALALWGATHNNKLALTIMGWLRK